MDTISGIGVGRLVRELRGDRVSQGVLALRARTSQSYISRLEAGQINPTVEQLEHLFNCLGYRLRIEAEPLPRRSDPEALVDQLAMTAEERMQSAAAIHNTLAELKAGIDQ